MTNPTQFYNNQLEKHSATLSEARKKLNISSTIRLLVFVAVCAGVYFSWGNGPAIVGVLVVGITVFLFLVSRHGKLQYQRDLAKALITANQTELKVLNRDFYELPSGEKYHNSLHFYSQDIDLFGRGSFFQYLNRTGLDSGSQLLADALLANDIENIPKRQEAIKELSTLASWRQQFSAIASLVKTEVSAHTVTKWLQEYVSFLPQAAKWVSRGFSIASLLGFVLYFFEVIPGLLLLGWFVLGLLISGRYLKKISALSAHTGKIQSTFDQYHKLLTEIEKQEMSAVLLSRKRTSIISTTHSASSVLKKFSKLLDALDQRNNILIGIIANGFFLRDIAIVYNIETWIATHKTAVQTWFEVIAFFDAYNSLGNYAFNHPTSVFPDITNAKNTFVTKAAAHPLLDPNTAVHNDFTIDTEQFFIITGANMAGKSTFLRTVALQIVMANTGLPVRAEKASYTPIKLITSMRTTDSLTDDESYFFSELKRLKFIVDAIKEDRYFIILDEILKGTNSTDKAIGSRKFIDKLVRSKSTGIIATHDLSLTDAAKELAAVHNYYFDAQIVDGELYFDYTFKEGICQNMNASFLLKKMEIVD